MASNKKHLCCHAFNGQVKGSPPGEKRVRRLPKACDRLRRIYQLTLKKYQMDVKRSKFKETLNVSLSGSFLPQVTPRKSKPPVRFTPDWVLQRGKMKNIVEPFAAIQMLVDTLALLP